MTLLGFNERFVPAIESRAKRHTIRALGKSGVCRFKVGDHVQLYRMVRQKGMRKIVDVDPVCTKIEPIEIDAPANVSVRDGARWRYLSEVEMLALAEADGFDTVDDFLDFFVPKRGDVFTGHIIHWDWL